MAADKGPTGPLHVCDICHKAKLTPFFVVTTPVYICNDHTFEGYDSRPGPGVCAFEKHPDFEIYQTARGAMCKKHLTMTLKVAVWPKGWP